MSHRLFHRDVLVGFGLIGGHSRIESTYVQGFSWHFKLLAAKTFMSHQEVMHHIHTYYVVIVHLSNFHLSYFTD